MRYKVRAKRKRLLAKADINVTPLIDVLLVLLVIFMVISPVPPEGFNTAIPQAPLAGLQQPRQSALILSVTGDGVIRINQEIVELPDLAPRLQDIFKTRSDRTIFVQADSNLLFNDVARVIDIAKGAGVLRIGLLSGGSRIPM